MNKNHLPSLAIPLVALILMLTAPQNATAFDAGAIRVGLGLYSQNVFGETTRSSDASPSTYGSSSYPLLVKYDWLVTTEWFFSPQLSYTPIGRDSASASAATTMLQLMLPVGFNLIRWTETAIDWQAGLGIVRYETKGAGGTESLRNGTQPATFARPGRTTTIQNYTFALGTSLTYGSSRVGLDLVFEGLLSSGKRTQSVSLSYAYRL